MRYLTLLALTTILPAMGKTEWTAVSSPNFELLTTESSGDAKRAIEYFEQVRDFFMRVKSQQLTTRLPVTIVVFRNAKEFKEYAVNEGAAAYYTGDQSRDFIVMSGLDENHKAVAVHEYMHLLVRHMELKLPVWLNEGIADVYSTLRPHGGRIVVGHAPQGRAWVLGSESWLKLPHLFSITRESPEYNEKNRMGVLYSQSWLLTHMLMLSETYGGKFGELVGKISSGVGSEQAIQEVYGKTLADVQRDLDSYYRARTVRGVIFNARLEKLQVGAPHAADPYQVELTLSRLTSMLNRRDEATRRLELLAKEHPERWEPMEALGQLSWRKGDFEGARAWFARAVGLKPENWSLYWDYARVAASGEADRPAVIDALRQVLARNGSHVDAKLMLAEQLFHTQQYAEALVAYSVITTIDPERAPRLFLGKAYALLRLQEFDKARSQAEEALKHARTPEHRDGAESVLKFLNRREEYAKRGFQVEAAPAMAAEQRVPLPGLPSHAGEEKPVLPSVRGVLQEVECKGPQARILLQAGQRQIGFLINDPDKVIIRNSPGTKMNLTCGKQPPGTSVLIEFEAKADREQGTIGEVRGLEFLK